MHEYRLLSTSGLLGYGFPEASLQAGMAREPHMIGVDGGSTDPGPYYLGSGKCVNSRQGVDDHAVHSFSSPSRRVRKTVRMAPR